MRGARLASATFMPWSIMFMMTWRVVVMMRGPPGVPVTRKGRPSRNTMVGLMEESGRLRGATALAAPPIRP